MTRLRGTLVAVVVGGLLTMAAVWAVQDQSLLREVARRADEAAP